ncbi:SRPBCC family protein [Streptomyces sp. NPDC102402]|uniref:SRPBCC family protein n=1 Tax=Streptomyces sp. NPDC102402 TaxID=3366169 RepID=UPI00381C7575
MATTTASIRLPVPPADVWQLIGGFGTLPDWLPYIPTSELGEGGRIRRLTNDEGGQIVERLEAFDDKARTYSYSILQAPFPVTGYLSTLTVLEDPDTGFSRVEWKGTFIPAGIGDDEAIALFHAIYSDGLEALRRTLAA